MTTKQNIVPPEYSAQDIPSAAEVMRAVKFLSTAEAKRWHRNRVELIVLAMLAGTGLRASELSKLNMAHVHDQDLRPFVKLPGSIVKRRPGCKGQGRSVPLTWAPSMIPIVQTWARMRRMEMKATAQDPFVCSLDAGRAGKRLNREQINIYAKNSMKAGGFWREGFTAHTYRHFFCTYACNHPSIGPVRARQAMGHSSLAVTNIYAHQTPDQEVNADIFDIAGDQ